MEFSLMCFLVFAFVACIAAGWYKRVTDEMIDDCLYALASLAAQVSRQKEELTKLNDQIGPYIEAMTASAKEEARVYEGLNNILNYNVGVAAKAKGGDE